MPRKEFVLGELARRIGGQVIGDADLPIRGVATLRRAQPDELSFLTNPRYRADAVASNAAAILVGPGAAVEGKTLLVARQPYAALAELLEMFHPECREYEGVDRRAAVDPTARLGEDVAIGPFAEIGPGAVVGNRATIGAGTVVGRDCEVGDDTVLYARVVLYRRTRVGARCRIHAGVVLGADGFGFASVAGVHRKIPQVGRVVIGDDVEIGANCAIDRGALEDTVIGSGTKIDDLVMIGHGVQVGEGSLLVAQSGVAGSTVLGHHVVLAGQSGIAGHLAIGDGSTIASKSAVFEDLAPGSTVAGIPAREHRAWRRLVGVQSRLPELRSEVARLRRRLDALEGTLGSRPGSEE